MTCMATKSPMSALPNLYQDTLAFRTGKRRQRPQIHDAFFKGVPIGGNTDFNAEPLAADCPYSHLQQGLIELSLGREPTRWRQAIDWEPLPSNDTGYVARMRSHDYTYEYWDVYLEPGKTSSPAMLACLTLIIHIQAR